MDRATIATNVLDNLDDLGAAFYTTSDINESLKDAYDRVALLTGCITKSVVIPTIAEPYWDIASLVPDYLYPLGIFNYATNRWLECRSTRYIDSLRWNWELWVGQPFYFTPIDFRRIAVTPHLTAQNGTLLLLYRAKPPVLTDSSTFDLPTIHQNILEFYSTADLFEQAKEFRKAQPFWERFSGEIGEVKRSIQDYAEGDKVRVLQPYLPFPRFGPGNAGGTNVMFIDSETPSGTINGVNTTFTLATSPNPATSLSLVVNGVVMFAGIGYVLTGNTIVFQTGYIPQVGDLIRAWYRVS